MRVRAGTSGFSYKEWKGSFYPDKLQSSGMLRFYASALPAVEINNTFYRMPKPDVLAGWAEQVPADFRFVLKASRRITHQQQLRDSMDSVAYLFKVAAILEDRLGPVLFQLPPFLKKNVELLRDFLAVLPDGFRAAFEFREASWFDDEVYAALAEHNAALVGGDMDDPRRAPPLVATADWGYLRFRAADYSEADLDRWAAKLGEQPWQEAYAFFKHETRGPELALALNARFAAPAPSEAKPKAKRPGVAKSKAKRPGVAKSKAKPKKRPARSG
jgi:uncharacterized protein YecE (DUF72 family)